MLPISFLLPLIGLIALFSGPVRAEGVAVTAIRIEGPGILRLDQGPSLRLVGIHIPPEQETPARDWLEKNAVGKKLYLAPPVMSDRYGRQLALALQDNDNNNGTTLQQHLLASGLALAWPEDGLAPDQVRLLMTAEDQARDEGKGLWKDTNVLPAEDTAAIMARRGSFAVVEGVVASAAKKNARLYLNFGPDWKTDFTLIQMPPPAGAFQADAWTGRHLRARGWIESINGPAIEVTNPAVIQTLPAGP